MFALTRARLAVALAAALVLAVPFSARAAAEKPFQDSDLADSAVQLEAQIKSDAGTPTKTLPQIRKDADAAFAKNDFRNGMMLLGQIVAAQPNEFDHLAAAWPHGDADPPGQRSGARHLAATRFDRGLYRLSAHRQPQRGSRQSRLLGRRHAAARAVAAVARCAAAVARDSRGARRARAIRAAARSVRLPRARLLGRRRHGVAARLLPVLGSFAGADRFLAVRRARRHRQAGDLDHREAALRRRLAARQQLHRHFARRPAVDGARVAVEVVRLLHLCARPQARGALLQRPPMCCRAPASAASR